jgi:hypothetical protein
MLILAVLATSTKQEKRCLCQQAKLQTKRRTSVKYLSKGVLLNSKTTMDAENYYEETGKLKDFFELVKKIK